jgi:hypothetical protein
MTQVSENLRTVDLPIEEPRRALGRIARVRRWDIAFVLLGGWHLVAFGLCYYLTIAVDYHGASGYLLIWIGELAGTWLIFRACGGPRRADQPPSPLEQLVRRVWLAYLVLAFNLGSLNTLRGHALFEFFPAIAPLASFALIVMSINVDRRFFAAVVVMFASGLLMAAYLMHAYLIFALSWWTILTGISIALLHRERRPHV